MTTPSEPTGLVSVRKNAQGLFAGYVGSRKVFGYDAQYNAKLWLAEQVLNNAEIAPSSCFTDADLGPYKQLVELNRTLI